jgi:drug/metabolite transporter (DMT)-like permease
LTPPVTSKNTHQVVLGAVCGAFAAVIYTLANIALRGCVDIDPFLVCSIKAFPTVVVLGPYLFWMHCQGKVIASNRSSAWRFIRVAFVGQFLGNATFQIALGSIGLANSVPITLGVLLIGGGFLGRVMLGEPLRIKTLLAIGILLVAVLVLSMPSEGKSTTASTELAIGSNRWIGAGCAAASGAAFALFGTRMRQTMNSGVSPELTMFISGMVGTIALAIVAMFRTSLTEIADVSWTSWSVMFAGGVFNFVAFVLLSTALKNLPVVAVNLINASQVAMAAVAGVILFSEPISASLIIGIGLTVSGLLILAYQRPRQREVLQ